MKKSLFLLFLCCLGCCFSYSQVLTDEENKLYKLLMQYRKEKGLLEIPVSKALTLVAQTHAKDLQDNQPARENCNMHSWSARGKWSSCCYTADHAQANCMWNKPRELTSYTGNGYEIAHGEEDAAATAEKALDGWKKSAAHNAVIINEGIWKAKWNAVGIGIYKGFAVAWFGNDIDN
jgi:Cysteine-rich secretory protein family